MWLFHVELRELFYITPASTALSHRLNQNKSGWLSAVETTRKEACCSTWNYLPKYTIKMEISEGVIPEILDA